MKTETEILKAKDELNFALETKLNETEDKDKIEYILGVNGVLNALFDWILEKNNDLQSNS